METKVLYIHLDYVECLRQTQPYRADGEHPKKKTKMTEVFKEVKEKQEYLQISREDNASKHIH